MTSHHKNAFCTTDLLWGESTAHRMIPLTKGPVMRSVDTFFVVSPEQIIEQVVDIPVIWDAMNLLWRYCNVVLMERAEWLLFLALSV